MRSAPRESTRLLERGSELAAVQAALDAARTGSGSILLVEGHGGVGKTRLLEEAATLGDGAGFETLRARSHELEGAFAFGVMRQLLEPALRQLAADERAELLAGSAALATPVLEAPTPTTGEQADIFPFLHGLFWLLSNLAERRPLALIVDDAHLADPASLRSLVYLAQRVADLPLVACVAARPAEPGPGAELLPQLRSHASTRPLALEPLSSTGVGWLVAEWGFPGADAHFVEACATASGGNPLYLRELLEVLGDAVLDGAPPSAAAVQVTGPRTVAQAIEITLRRLPAEATALVRAIAVLADDCSLRHAAQLASVDEATAVPLAAALSDGGVLRPGTRLGFVHPIVRAAIYDDLRPVERAYAHAQAARQLSNDGEPAEAIAAHLLLAEPLRERWASEALTRAGRDAATRGDAESAARLLTRALAEPDEPGRRARVLIDLAGAEGRLGEPGAASHYEQALELLEAPDDRARVLLALGRSLFQQGRYAPAADALDRGRDEQPADPTLAAELYSGWANAVLWDPARAAMAFEALRTVEVPTTVGERMAFADLAGGMTLRGEEDHRVAMELASLAWADGDLLEQGGPELPAYFAIAPTFGWGDDLDTAQEIYGAVVEAARRRGLVHVFATAMYGAGGTHLYRGELVEAIAALESAFDAQRYGWGQFITGAYHMLSQALVERGELAGAARLLDLPDERERELSATGDFMAVHSARGHLLLAQGKPSTAVPEFEAAGRLAEMIGAESAAFFPWRPGLARALVATGERDLARAVAGEQLGRARRWGAPSIVGEAQAVVGALEATPEARLAGMQAAVETLAPSPARLRLAYALLDLGRAQAETGDRTGARESLRGALDLADRCGAIPLAARARGELVAAGGRPRRARRSGTAALTPAQLRVARMAAAGSTNREIAEDLFVTVKAVKWHLGHAYRKLGITSREQLSAALASESPGS